jgi:uncharacterized protein HemY
LLVILALGAPVGLTVTIRVVVVVVIVVVVVVVRGYIDPSAAQARFAHQRRVRASLRQ